jgi:hypothetical protein
LFVRGIHPFTPFDESDPTNAWADCCETNTPCEELYMEGASVCVCGTDVDGLDDFLYAKVALPDESVGLLPKWDKISTTYSDVGWMKAALHTGRDSE